jgi:hypothetical protein
MFEVADKMKKHISCSIALSETHTVYDIMSKYLVETERPQVTSQHGAYALRAGIARLW